MHGRGILYKNQAVMTPLNGVCAADAPEEPAKDRIAIFDIAQENDLHVEGFDE